MSDEMREAFAEILNEAIAEAEGGMVAESEPYLDRLMQAATAAADAKYLPVIEKLVASFNAAKEEIRWYKQKSGGDVESGRIIGAENILAEFRAVTRMAEALAATVMKGGK